MARPATGRVDGLSRKGDLRTFPTYTGNIHHEGGKAKCVRTRSKQLSSARHCCSLRQDRHMDKINDTSFSIWLSQMVPVLVFLMPQPGLGSSRTAPSKTCSSTRPGCRPQRTSTFL